MNIRSAVDAIIEAADHTHQWEMIHNTNGGRFRCATCGQTFIKEARTSPPQPARNVRPTYTDFTTKTLAPFNNVAKAGQWATTKTKQAAEFRSHDDEALRVVRQAANRAGLNVTSEPLMLSTNTLKISGFLSEESEYQGRKVTLNKPFRTPGGPKKFSVYVRNDKGNVVKVNFGDPNMEIRRDDPERRKNFLARHNCQNPGPKWKAKYWSCKWGWGPKKLGENAAVSATIRTFLKGLKVGSRVQVDDTTLEVAKMGHTPLYHRLGDTMPRWYRIDWSPRGDAMVYPTNLNGQAIGSPVASGPSRRVSDPATAMEA